jgi:sulfonate transport system substrate-binding protein
MKTANRNYASLLALPLAGLSLAVVLSLASPSGTLLAAHAQEPKVIHVVANRSVSGVALWGIGPFAKQHGVTIDMATASTNAEMQRAIQTGSAQVGSLGYQSPAIMADQNVSNVKVIAGTFVGGQNLVMRKGVELRSWKELEGKRIGMPPGSYVAILFVLAAGENGVDVTKVKIINTTSVGPTELQALSSGDLDGLVMWTPVVDRAVVDGYAYYPPCCDIGSTKPYGDGDQVLGANTEFLKNRRTAVNFLNAFAEAIDFYVKNPDKAVDIIGQYTGVSKAILNEALKHARWDYRVDVQAAENIAKKGPAFGLTRADTSDKIRGYFDLPLLSEATGKPVDYLSVLRP